MPAPRRLLPFGEALRVPDCVRQRALPPSSWSVDAEVPAAPCQDPANLGEAPDCTTSRRKASPPTLRSVFSAIAVLSQSGRFPSKLLLRTESPLPSIVLFGYPVSGQNILNEARFRALYKAVTGPQCSRVNIVPLP